MFGFITEQDEDMACCENCKSWITDTGNEDNEWHLCEETLEIKRCDDTCSKHKKKLIIR